MSYKKCEQLVSDILKLKGFYQGDIVEYNNQEWIVLYQELKKKKPIKTEFCSILRYDNHGWVLIKEWVQIKDLKLKQRDISLPMVLEAMKIKNKNETFYLLYLTQEEDYRMMLIINNEGVEWVIRKNGKDCNLSDQSEEVFKLIVGVLK